MMGGNNAFAGFNMAGGNKAFSGFNMMGAPQAAATKVPCSSDCNCTDTADME